MDVIFKELKDQVVLKIQHIILKKKKPRFNSIAFTVQVISSTYFIPNNRRRRV